MKSTYEISTQGAAMRRFVSLCAVVLLLGGCGSTSKPKQAEPQTEAVNLTAKQLQALPREIKTLTIPGDAEFSFVGVFLSQRDRAGAVGATLNLRHGYIKLRIEPNGKASIVQKTLPVLP
jgi:predicted component of type VI protein secretion system